MSMHEDKFDCIASDDPVNTQCEPTKIVEIPGRVTHSLSEQMSYAIDSADSSISGFDIYEDQDKTSKGPNEVLSDPHLRSESARSNNESEQPLLSTAISNDQSDLGSVLESRSIVENGDILEDAIGASSSSSSSCSSPSHGPEGSSEHELPSEEIGEINSDEEDDAEENEMDDDNAEVEDVEEEVESDILDPDNEIEDDVLNNEDDGIHDMEDDDNENEDGDDEEVMLQQALALSLAEHNARTTRSSESIVNTRQISSSESGTDTNAIVDGESNVESTNALSLADTIASNMLSSAGDVQVSVSISSSGSDFGASDIENSGDRDIHGESEKRGYNLVESPKDAGYSGIEGSAKRPELDGASNENVDCCNLDRNDFSFSNSIPPKPHYPYSSLLRPMCVGTIEEDLNKESSFTNCLYDPDNMVHFGKLPIGHVLNHLLSCTSFLYELEDSVRSKDIDNDIVKQASAKISCPSLFPTCESSSPNAPLSDKAFLNELLVTLHLLIASIQVCSEIHADAIQILMKLKRNTSSLDSSRLLSSPDKTLVIVSEGSAPACTPAYVKSTRNDTCEDNEQESNISLSTLPHEDPAVCGGNTDDSKTSDDFASKGMLRKARAAAEAEKISRIRHNLTIEKLCQVIDATSFSSLSLLRTLRRHLQYMTREVTNECFERNGKEGKSKERGMNKNDNDSGFKLLTSAIDLVNSTVRVKLQKALLYFFDSENCKKFSACFDEEMEGDSDRKHKRSSLTKNITLNLANEAIDVWYLAIPIIYPTVDDRVALLRSLIPSALSREKRCSTFLSAPWSVQEQEGILCEILCRRLCCSDMLNSFFPSTCASFSLSSASSSSGKEVDFRVFSVLNVLYSSFFSVQTKNVRRETDPIVCDDSIRQLFLALAHRCNTDLILRVKEFNKFKSKNFMSSFACNGNGLTFGELDECDLFSLGLVGDSSNNPWDVTGHAGHTNSSDFDGGLLTFSQSRCSDSISVVPSNGKLGIFAPSTSDFNGDSVSSSFNGNTGSTVVQRASKVWGAVLSSTSFKPQTGIHRWAVRLDRCERGHVFVGVGTSQASNRTYVGGDKHGWGFIGTQALWHDRSKIRGDYGSTFRTGSTIVVTLNSDVGSLSFGILRESGSTGHLIASSQSISDLLSSDKYNQNQSLHIGEGGNIYVEDWGVAFEGLPLACDLHPAVGLYQRDDRVTLMSISDTRALRSLPSSVSTHAPLEGNPFSRKDATSRNLLNDRNNFYGIGFVKFIIGKCQTLVDEALVYISEKSTVYCENQTNILSYLEGTACLRHPLLTQVLPSVVCSLILMTQSNAPEACLKYAMALIPHLTHLTKLFDRLIIRIPPDGKTKKNDQETSCLSSDDNAQLDVKVKREKLVSCAISPFGRLDGSWVVRAESRVKHQSEDGKQDGGNAHVPVKEYNVNFTSSDSSVGPQYGSFVQILHGSGNSKTQENVKINGIVEGGCVQFSEEWSLASSTEARNNRIVEARLNLTGTCFQGRSFDVSRGTVCQIAGIRIDTAPSDENLSIDKEKDSILRQLVRIESLLSLATGNFSGLIGGLMSSIDIDSSVDGCGNFFEKGSICSHQHSSIQNQSSSVQHRWCSSSLFCGGLIGKSEKNDKSSVTMRIDELQSHYRNVLQTDEAGRPISVFTSSDEDVEIMKKMIRTEDEWEAAVWKTLYEADDGSTISQEQELRYDGAAFESIDNWAMKSLPAQSGFGKLVPDKFSMSRRMVVATILHHTGLITALLREFGKESQRACSNTVSSIFSEIWRNACLILERKIRNENKRGLNSDYGGIKGFISHTCDRVNEQAQFLLRLNPATKHTGINSEELSPTHMTVVQQISEFLVTTEPSDINHLERNLELVMKKGYMRVVGFASLRVLLDGTVSDKITLEPEKVIKGRRPFEGSLKLASAVEQSLVYSLLQLFELDRSGQREPSLQFDEGRSSSKSCKMGRYYLSNLDGCAVINKVRSEAHNLYTSLGSMLHQICNESTNVSVSLFISLLSPWSNRIMSDDQPLLSSTCILKTLSKVLESYRTKSDQYEFSRVTLEEPTTSQSYQRTIPVERKSADLELFDSAVFHARRKIFNSAFSSFQVLCVQLAMQSSDTHARSSAEKSLNQNALELLRHEFAASTLIVQRLGKHLSVHQSEQNFVDDYKCWCEESSVSLENAQLEQVSSRMPASQTSLPGGLDYLMKFGGINPLTLWKSAGSVASGKKLRKSASVKSFCSHLVSHGQHLSRILNTLYAVIQTESQRERFGSGNWLKSLIYGVGLEESGQLKSNNLPPTYRARLLRFLRYILPLTNPSNTVIRSLFVLAGAARKCVPIDAISDQSEVVFGDQSSDESSSSFEGAYYLSLVGDESISLLRHLFSLGTKNLWPDMMISVLRDVLIDCVTSRDDLIEKHGFSNIFQGCLNFLGGMPCTLQVGGYVLMKPTILSSTSASSGSPSVQSSSSLNSAAAWKGATSSSGLRGNDFIGGGVESVVTGLCRKTALAGIVSNIDSSNLTCEAVLFDRQNAENNFHDTDNESSDNIRDDDNKAHRVATVRAVRVQVSDIVAAEEIPLTLYPDLVDLMVSLFPRAAHKLLSLLCPNTSEVQTMSVSSEDGASLQDTCVENIIVSIMKMIRSAILCFSSKDILEKFISSVKLSSDNTHDCFSSILRVASGDWTCQGESSTASLESLAAIPNREHNLAHLMKLHADIRCKIVALGNVQSSTWWWENTLQANDSLKTPVKVRESLALEGNASNGVEDDAQQFVTPPVNLSGRNFDSVANGSQGNEDGSDSTSTAEGDSNSAHHDNSSSTTTGAAHRQRQQQSQASEEDIHLHEAAIAQMAELGLPRSWSEFALRRVGGGGSLASVEAAVHFCLERGGDMERLIADERERERLLQGASGSTRDRRRGTSSGSTSNPNQLIRQLLEMGFPSHWCAEALAAARNDVDEALTWILTNGERLSARDHADGEEEDDDDDDEDADEVFVEDEDEDEAKASSTTGEADELTLKAGNINAGSTTATQESELQHEVEQHQAAESLSVHARKKKRKKSQNEREDSNDSHCNRADQKDGSMPSWSRSICPVRFVSGQSNIDPNTLEISGLASGGFASVGTKGVLLTSGKWYYEAELLTAGCLQIGWADGSFAGHCQSDRGDGCGDGPSSWAFDGWRRYKWHGAATEWGCRWDIGDVVGCLVDMDDMSVSFTLNGRAEEVGMGVAFSNGGFRPCGGVYACVSFNRKEKLRINLGGPSSRPFKFSPPERYRAVGDAVLDAVKERDYLVNCEQIMLGTNMPSTDMIEVTSESAKTQTSTEPSYLVDLSDGEHGHELFAWQHRYYGSDASVHLGGGGRGSARGTGKDSGKRSDAEKSSALERVRQRWKTEGLVDSQSRINDAVKLDDANEARKDTTCSWVMRSKEYLAAMKQGYLEVESEISGEIRIECLALSVLYAKKLLLHMISTLGSSFLIQDFLNSDDEIYAEEMRASIRFWKVIEGCVSLRSAGWVGEPGAMALAAEALGLGISSHDSSGAASGNPVPCLSQALTCVRSSHLYSKTTTNDTFAACAESGLGSEGAGLVFMRTGLQNAAGECTAFRNILVAVVRKMVRLLSSVDYVGNDSPNSEEDEEVFENKGHDKMSDSLKGMITLDARLVSFLTGLLLSTPVQSKIPNESVQHDMMCDLFEAWSVGLLSGSAPWRMVCALTAAGILNLCPPALAICINRVPTLHRLYSRLESTVTRRVWAERASTPICSRYVQSYIELLASVKRTKLPEFKNNFFAVDAATPMSLMRLRSHEDKGSGPSDHSHSWECDEGWISSDSGWEILSGTVKIMPVEWTPPSRSAMRAIFDSGEGPPMLGEGGVVMRGLDWDSYKRETDDSGNEDGLDLYEKEKVSREKRKLQEKEAQSISEEPDSNQPVDVDDHIETPESKIESNKILSPEETVATPTPIEQSTPVLNTPKKGSTESKKKLKKIPNPKLPVGTVLSIEPWDGVPGQARKIRWNLTGKEGIYRYGGDGGRYDLAHVEVNEKCTRIKKRHPLPESAEQCASRHGFGAERTYSILLRLHSRGNKIVHDGEIERIHDGVLEWPDFGAGIRVECCFHCDGALAITEKELVFGSRDNGWEPRFGQPSFVPGSVMILSPVKATSLASVEDDYISGEDSQENYEVLLGCNSFKVKNLRNRGDGGKLRVTCEMRISRGKRSSLVSNAPTESSGNSDRKNLTPVTSNSIVSAPPPITFDRDFHNSSISLSQDCRTLTCVSSEGRGTAFASAGFIKGVHYWEVKIEQADVGSVFIGVAEKPTGASTSSSTSPFPHENQQRLNRWLGWGFVNFRATYTSGAERVYGAHCHSGDTVGVQLNCDTGRISFFLDGMKYGEHILNDLGCAFENVSPFGFNADGCGSGGFGQGAPSGIDGGRGGRYPANGVVRPRALWPVIGLRNSGDRVTISDKWTSSYGVDAVSVVNNITSVDEIMCWYSDCETSNLVKNRGDTKNTIPRWFIKESFMEYQRWQSEKWLHSSTRGGKGLDAYFDTSPAACASACSRLGLKIALLSGDIVSVRRSAGRVLELTEEAMILGAMHGRLYYRLISQKSEGGSLTEGGGRAWFWDESEVVDDGVKLISKGRGLGIDLPLIKKFRCPSKGGLRIVYASGAVLRSDLEIFDGSMNIGTIPQGTIIERRNVLERRINSCGVCRYRIKYEPVGEGWISGRIRGGKEEAIVELVESPSSASDVVPADESIEVNANCDEDEFDNEIITPEDAGSIWYENYSSRKRIDEVEELYTPGLDLSVKDINEFETLLRSSTFPGLTTLDSDCIFVSALSDISDQLPAGDALDCSFKEVTKAFLFLHSMRNPKFDAKINENQTRNTQIDRAVTSAFSRVKDHDLPSLKAMLVRSSMVRALNRRVRMALPWLPVRPAQEGSAILGGLLGFGASIEKAGLGNDSFSKPWVLPPSIAGRMRKFRKLIFSCVKTSFLNGIVSASTTPTPLSHDEYELPREVRTVRVNRLKARRSLNSAAKRKNSVFSQLQQEMRAWSGAALRRGHVAKGHGGQKRAFKVKLIGEGVNDYSGPYREVFTDAMREVTEVDGKGLPLLGVLTPSANNENEVGDHRELFAFAQGTNSNVCTSRIASSISRDEESLAKAFSSATYGDWEAQKDIAERLMFLGKLVGTACRHGIPVDLHLPQGIFWNKIVEETSTSSFNLREIDLLAWQNVEQEEYCEELLSSQQKLLNFFCEGLASVMPFEILALFTGPELRDLICGNPDVDVDLLRRVVEYEGYNENDAVIGFFWESLHEMTSRELKLFLQFVWARNRLPCKESDFEAPFKIVRNMNNATDSDAVDGTLPSASTCFFSLTLPEYSKKQILKDKLLFAIENVCTMESDYVTNEGEVEEGWRGL